MQISEITNTHVATDSLALWWLGQSGFAVKTDNQVIYLDPYLSTRLERLTADKPEKRHIRLCEIPVLPEEITNADYVFCSHDHGDHIDPDTLLPLSRSSEKANFIVPYIAQKTLLAMGISASRIFPVSARELFDLGKIRFTAVPGKHNEFDWSYENGFPYLGYIIHLNGVTIFHAGDTVMYDGLSQSLTAHNIDIALLPINGGNPELVSRGFMSNLNFREAADLGAAIGAKIIIPTHYDMFDINTEKVERFTEYITNAHPKQKYQVMTLGERFVFSRY